MLIFQRLQSADSTANQYAEAIAIYPVQFEAAVLHRHLRRGHGQLRKTVGPAGIFEIIEEIFRIEIANFTGNLAIVVRCIESLDLTNTAPAFGQIFPKGLYCVAYGCNHAQACDDNSAICVHLAK